MPGMLGSLEGCSGVYITSLHHITIVIAHAEHCFPSPCSCWMQHPTWRKAAQRTFNSITAFNARHADILPQPLLSMHTGPHGEQELPDKYPW